MAGVPMVGVAPYMVAGASLDSGGGPTKQVVFLHSGEGAPLCKRQPLCKGAPLQSRGAPPAVEGGTAL